MIQTQRNSANVVIIVLLLYLQTTHLEAGRSKKLCPIGFEVAYSSDGDPMCYRKKGPETFADKFTDCAGNLYTHKLLLSLNITPSDQHTIWTDYKNLYEGGPYVDWSYTKDTGDLFEATYSVNIDSKYNVNEWLCVVVDPVINLTAVRCDELHYRYCFINIYEDVEVDGCESMSNPEPDPDDPVPSEDELLQRSTYRFMSPMPTCLLKVSTKRVNQMVRMTWDQSQKACESRGGSLLNRGWRYSNYPTFSTNTKASLTYPLYPFGVLVSLNLTLLRYDAVNDTALIPQSEWKFVGPMSSDTRLGAVRDDSWELVNSSYTFYDVICEKTIPLKHVNLTVSSDEDDKDIIVLNVDNPGLDQKYIYCFTDSSSYFPQSVKVIKRKPKPGYLLKFIKDGLYWCTHSDSKNFYISESNKFLHIKVKEDTENLYAVKVTSLAHDYSFTDIAKVRKDWKKRIEEYVHYTTMYTRTIDHSDTYDNYTIWKFRNDSPVSVRMASVDVVVKRLYLNSRTALLHVKLNPKSLPVKPGQWNDIQIDYMLPAYYCEQRDPLARRLALGESSRASECKIYNCKGDFNEGVQIVITAEDTCFTPQPQPVTTAVTVDDLEASTDAVYNMPTAAVKTNSTTRTLRHDGSDSSEEDVGTTTDLYELTTEYPDKRPTPGRPPPGRPTTPPTTPVQTVVPTFTPPPEITTPLPPQDQLLQVLEDLGSLLSKPDPVMVEDIQDSFNLVDELLADTQDLEIPGDLLHILDTLGGRLDLNGSAERTAVRPNLALLVADAQPAAPLKGLKIATRTDDMFSENAFQFLRNDINDTHLLSDTNEVVIQLPESVSASNKRVSFVVFRNDRAFQRAGLYAVNSRVLSVNIENTTHFHGGEMIDIYLTPLENNIERNQSRSCAFWKFLDDGSGDGIWSQEGCVFTPSRAAGMLDSCSCDHLTHFAEVLVPRTVYSEKNEKALEVLSVIGSCFSIFGIIWVGVTAVMFRSWRRDYSNKVWLQLCVSILIMSIAFLVSVYAHFEVYDVMCMITGIVLHFTVLSSFCWMLVAAVLSYRRLVTVFTRDATHKLLRASAFAWGVPFAVVGILLSVAPHAYAGRFDDKNPSTAFCYPSGLALTLSVYAPIALMLVANWTLFALIVRSVFASGRNHPNRQLGNRHSETREALRCASVSFFLVFLFGLPWIFGLFSMNVVMAYLFVILSNFQGFVLFLFFVLGNKKTRDLWLNKLKIKQTRKIPVTSSTYTNNRSTANAISRSNQGETIEAKVSRPRSLSSEDNSRFS